MATLIDEAIQYGIMQGEERGIKKEITKGMIQGKIEAIIDILSIRFGEEDLDNIRQKINNINDIEFIDYLKAQAKKVSSIEEFKRLIDKV